MRFCCTGVTPEEAQEAVASGKAQTAESVHSIYGKSTKCGVCLVPFNAMVRMHKAGLPVPLPQDVPIPERVKSLLDLGDQFSGRKCEGAPEYVQRICERAERKRVALTAG